MREKNDPDTESPTHQRPPFADPLAGKMDPTAPGAPHEPGGVDYRQSRASGTEPAAEPDRKDDEASP